MSGAQENRWRKAVLESGALVRHAMEVIAESRLHICMVVADDDRLIGTITDGDIRRALLRGVTLDDLVTSIMNENPVFAPLHIPQKILSAKMLEHGIREMPLVDELGRVTGIRSLNPKPEDQEPRENWVAVLAGGRGCRLRPLTDELPKPMIEVGPRPILETILEQIMLHGFRRFFISVNYMAEKIIDHFGDGSSFGAEIRYLREDNPLGTAGSLSLIDEPIDCPILAINGDVLNQMNFSSLLQYHHDHQCAATMCVRDSEFQVPFGIVSIQNGVITEIVEKPAQRHFVNAGIYVLDPSVLIKIPSDTPIDMPDLFNQLIADSEKTMAFPIGEYWTDVGRPEDLVRAGEDFAKNFRSSSAGE